MALHFELVSPERLLMSAEVAMVTIPGVEGDMGILPGHAPVLSTLRPGVVTATGDAAHRPRAHGRLSSIRIAVRGDEGRRGGGIPEHPDPNLLPGHVAEHLQDEVSQRRRNRRSDAVAETMRLMTSV